MANQKQGASKRLNMAERAQQQLELHFPNFAPAWIWRRKTNDGYTTLPRTLPLVMQAVDAQSKGQPAGHTLFCLWARSPDHPLVTIENPATFASEAGFEGERAVDTWRRRMKRLQELCLIVAKRGPSGDFHYVLLMNPNVAMESMHRYGKVQSGLYGRFIDRLYEVGGQGDLEAIRIFWEQQKQAEQAAMAATIANPVATAVSIVSSVVAATATPSQAAGTPVSVAVNATPIALSAESSVGVPASTTGVTTSLATDSSPIGGKTGVEPSTTSSPDSAPLPVVSK